MRYLKPLFLTTAVVIAGTLGSLTLLAWPQARVRGTITGTVTADRGNVIGLRVTAHNLDLRLWYIVFTNKGRYTIPQALPGRYEVTVNEEGYEASTVTLPLAAAD